MVIRGGRLLAVAVLLASAALVACNRGETPTLRVAAAANLQPLLEALRADFEQECRCRLDITSGATGMLYSQIQAGVPFDIFLASDARRPQLLRRDGLVAPGSLRVFARGRLALWASRTLLTDGGRFPGFVPAAEAAPEQLRPILKQWRGKIVIADPQVAPYGYAAVEFLRKLGLWSRLQDQVVYASNSGHTQILLQEGRAQMGLIPVSLALISGSRGDYMTISSNLYPALRQQSVILRDARSPALAQRFQVFLLSPAVQSRLPELGYSPVLAR